MKAESLLQTERECILCKSPYVELHHVFYGTANRRLSDEDGCVVWLCRYHHTGQGGVHRNKDLDNLIKWKMEKAWIDKFGTEDDFRKRYGKTFL